MLKHCPAGLDADLAEYRAGKDASLLDVARDTAEGTQELLDLDKEVKSATSTLRELQRQMALLKARLSVLNSSENYPSDGAESGGSATGEDELISSSGPGQNLVRCTTVMEGTPKTNTETQEDGCAVLGAGAGGHNAGFTTAMVIV